MDTRPPSHGSKLLLAAAIALIVTGCSGDGDVTITGKVTLEGEPVPTGAITFVPVDGATKVAGAQIRDGGYEARVPPGEKIVQISGTRPEKKEMFDALTKSTIVAEQAIRMTPELYETPKSPLRADVKEEGTFDFDVPKKAPKK